MINFDRTKAQVPTIKNNYKTKRVYDALEVVFYNKCYLCEIVKPDPRNFEIEHFTAHKGNSALKYLWINLYLACGGTCNQYKGDTEILDPCNEDVETLIIYELVPFDYVPRFSPIDPKNPKIVATCNLLDRIHNGHKGHSKLKTKALREAIRERAAKLKTAIIAYYKNADKQAERYIALQEIKSICSRYSSYTMLMRAVATDEMNQEDLQNLFD